MNNRHAKHRHDGILPSDQTPDTDVTRPPGEDHPFLPHERDESPDPRRSTEASQPHIEQAARDIRRGLRDTDRRGTPSDVPGPGANPEHSPGADVPPPREGGSGGATGH